MASKLDEQHRPAPSPQSNGLFSWLVVIAVFWGLGLGTYWLLREPAGPGPDPGPDFTPIAEVMELTREMEADRQENLAKVWRAAARDVKSGKFETPGQLFENLKPDLQAATQSAATSSGRAKLDGEYLKSFDNEWEVQNYLLSIAKANEDLAKELR